MGEGVGGWSQVPALLRPPLMFINLLKPSGNFTYDQV
jgi:hypothetical protein